MYYLCSKLCFVFFLPKYVIHLSFKYYHLYADKPFNTHTHRKIEIFPIFKCFNRNFILLNTSETNTNPKNILQLHFLSQ